jgi:hypothetical protein
MHRENMAENAKDGIETKTSQRRDHIRIQIDPTRPYKAYMGHWTKIYKYTWYPSKYTWIGSETLELRSTNGAVYFLPVLVLVRELLLHHIFPHD